MLAGEYDPNGIYLENVVRIAAGANFSMALTRNGRVLSWGANAAGQLGNGGVNTGVNSRPVEAILPQAPIMPWQ